MYHLDQTHLNKSDPFQIPGPQSASEPANQHNYILLENETKSGNGESVSRFGHSSFRSLASSLIRTGLPFFLLSASYSMWFISQKIFNKNFRTNVFGYTSLDQILAPFYLLIYLSIVEHISPFRRKCLAKEDQSQTLKEAIIQTFGEYRAYKCRGFVTVFFYRFLINARAMAYFYMGVVYDLDVVYLELTLTRVVISWIMALVICGIQPDFISMNETEKKTVFLPINIALKTFGTILITFALILIS